MKCNFCGIETKTKNLEIKVNDGHLIGLNGAILICCVCRRRQDGDPWRFFRLLQILKLY